MINQHIPHTHNFQTYLHQDSGLSFEVLPIIRMTWLMLLLHNTVKVQDRIENSSVKFLKETFTWRHRYVTITKSTIQLEFSLLSAVHNYKSKFSCWVINKETSSLEQYILYSFSHYGRSLNQIRPFWIYSPSTEFSKIWIRLQESNLISQA